MYTYTLNIAVSTGKSNWNGSGFTFIHFAFIELGDDEHVARTKAAVFVESLGKAEYKFTFSSTKKQTMVSEEL